MKSLIIYFIIALISSTVFANPPGLNMQNKTPHGWSEGKKEGWEQKEYYEKNHFKHHHHHHHKYKYHYNYEKD